MARGCLVLFLCQVFQNAPALEESAWHVEATFPFSALERKQHFALAVKIAKPFRMFGVGKMRPYVVVNTVEPFKAFLATGELVALDHGDERLDVHPAEFLLFGSYFFTFIFRFFYLSATQFEFDESVSSVIKIEYGIGFQIISVMIR